MHIPANPNELAASLVPPGPVAGAFDAVADRYDESYRDARCTAEDRLLKDRLDGFLHTIDGHGRVLDVGCGTGHFLRLTGWPQTACTGIDIAPEMVRRADAEFPRGVFLECSLELPLPLIDGNFDAAVALYCALSYVAAPLQALHEIARVLAPGGRLFGMVYSPAWYRAYSHRVPAVDVTTAPAAWSVWQTRRRLELALFTDIRLTAFSMLPTPLIRYEAPLARLLPGHGRYLIFEATRR